MNTIMNKNFTNIDFPWLVSVIHDSFIYLLINPQHNWQMNTGFKKDFYFFSYANIVGRLPTLANADALN